MRNEVRAMEYKQYVIGVIVSNVSGVLSREIGKWDGQGPKFIACQFSIWGNITLKAIKEIEDRMKEQTGGRFEFVRADDFFRMYYASKK